MLQAAPVLSISQLINHLKINITGTGTSITKIIPIVNEFVVLSKISISNLISVLNAYFPSFMAKTYTVLVAIFSWAIRT
jgi:hypothetical protein